MTLRANLFALAALVPAALNATPAAGTQRSLLVPVCNGSGAVHMVRVPLGDPALPGSSGEGCCAKACHTGGSRKRSCGQIEPAQ